MGQHGGHNRILFTDDMLRQIELLAGYGLSIGKIAAVMGFSDATLDNRKRDNKKVGLAIARGRATAERNVAKVLYDVALSGDVKALKWLEQSRYNRVETSRQEVKQETDVTINVVPHKE